ncbi:hypothetical protein D3C76_1795110 [compost metagenome]
MESGLTKKALKELRVFSAFISNRMASRFQLRSMLKWSSRNRYDIVLDCDELGLDGCAKAIAISISDP